MTYFNSSNPAHVFYKKTDDDKINFLSFPFPSYYSNVTDLNESFSIKTYLGSFLISELSAKLKNSVPFSGPYPLAVRYMDENYSIIERPPFQVKVDYSPTRSGRTRRSIKPVTIWIPWTVCLLNIKNPHYSKIFFNDAPIQSLDDIVILPWTSNVFQDGKICLGQSSRQLQIEDYQNYDIYSWYHNFLNEYFFGGWNSDIHCYDTYEFSRTVPNLFFSNYSELKNITSHNSVQQEIVDKIKSSKIKFHSSYLSTFTMANIYYNLSLLNLEQTLSVVTSFKNSDFISHHKKTSLSSLIQEENYKAKFSLANLETFFPVSYLFKDSISVNVNIKNNTCIPRIISEDSLYSSPLNNYIYKFLQTNQLSTENSYYFGEIREYMKNHFNTNYTKLLENNSESILNSVVADITNPLQSFNIEGALTATYQDLESFVNTSSLFKEELTQ